MGKENTRIVMAATIMEIGLRERWKDKVNYMIVKEIWNMKDNGRMIIFKGEENYSVYLETGLNTRDSFKPAENKVLVNCFFVMEIVTKANSRTIILGAREECSNRMVS